MMCATAEHNPLLRRLAGFGCIILCENKDEEKTMCVYIQSQISSIHLFTNKFEKVANISKKTSSLMGNWLPSTILKVWNKICLLFMVYRVLGMGSLTCYGTLVETEGHFWFFPSTRWFSGIKLSLSSSAVCCLIHYQSNKMCP